MNIINFSNKNNEEKTGIFLYIVALIFLLISTYICLTRFGLWNDEFFSLYIVNLSWSDLVTRATRDVHPILYYLILKTFIDAFSFLNADIVIARIVSLIPFYLIAILSITKIRWNFGMLTAGIFFLCMSSMPQLMIFSVEIRMYSWALFFVTASIIYAFEILQESSLKNWLILTVLTICSFHTHYFSAIASGVIYLMLLIYLVINNRSFIKNYFISLLLVIIAFLPWAFVVLNQIGNVNNNFWIDPITFKTLISYVFFVLSPAEIFVKANELIDPTILGSLMFISFIILIYKIRDKFSIICLFTFILVPVLGIILSQVVSPIFHQRYLIPSLGLLWLAFSILLAKSFNDKKIFIPILLLVLIVGIVGTVDFIEIQNQDALITDSEFNALNDIVTPDDIVICGSHKFRFPVSDYYLKKNTVYCFEENLNKNISNLINNGSRILFIDYPDDNKILNTNYTVHQIAFNGTILEKEVVIYEIVN